MTHFKKQLYHRSTAVVVIMSRVFKRSAVKEVGRASMQPSAEGAAALGMQHAFTLLKETIRKELGSLS
jgi:hypothetical protein